MSNLAGMAIDLLCKLSFQPDGGHDPADLAEIEHACWQTLIHDLDPDEQDEARRSVQSQVDDLRTMDQESLPDHLRTQLSMLEAFLRGELG